MSQEAKTLHPVARASLAIAALVFIVVAGNMLISSLGIGHKTLDLTEDRIHTLSEGTGKILGELGAPVVIRYYASRNTAYMPEDLKLHMRRVDDLLAEYESLAPDGRLRIENLDPEPDTDAEDAADLDGISGQTINNDNVYLGLAISCLDRTTTIPFLNPRDETMLEYEISRAIAEVSATRKPVIGLMSALAIAGGPPTMPGQQPASPWIIYNQLQQAYEVEDLTMTPGEIDAERYSLVLLIHPAEITPEAEYAIDQYLLKGGTVMACLDPFSYTAQRFGGGNPMMGMGGVPTSSTLPTLLKKWGVEMSTSQVIADGKYAEPRANHPCILTIPREGMPQEDNIVTKDLNSITLLFPGGFTKIGGGGVSVDTLARSSTEAGTLGSMSILGPQTADLATQIQPDGKVYDFILHLKGEFTSAFPDGNPSDEPDPQDSSGESDESGESDPSGEEENSTHLAKAEKPGNVFLISDVDAFHDDYAYQTQRLGTIQLSQPINGNSSLFFNLIDQAASSTHLIGSRSRAATSRPFTTFREMETQANRRVGEKIREFEEQAEEAQRRINTLQAERRDANSIYATPEQEEEIRKFRQQEVEARRQVRELRKDLRREKDSLAASIIAWNIAGVPSAIVLIGLGLFAARRTRTRAR